MLTAITGCVALLPSLAEAQSSLMCMSDDFSAPNPAFTIAYFEHAETQMPGSVVFRVKSALETDRINLHLPRLGRKSRHFTLNNFIISPGVDGDIPKNWINGTSRIKIINLLFDTAYRLKLFKRS